MENFEKYMTTISLIVGIILLVAGLIWGYIAYTAPLEHNQFLIAMGVAFVGVILTLIAFAFGMGGSSESSE